MRDALDPLLLHRIQPIAREWSCRTGREKRLWLDRLELVDGHDDLDRLCRSIFELTTAEPGTAARALAVEPAVLEVWLHGGRETRRKALLREGVISLVAHVTP